MYIFPARSPHQMKPPAKARPATRREGAWYWFTVVPLSVEAEDLHLRGIDGPDVGAVMAYAVDGEAGLRQRALDGAVLGVHHQDGVGGVGDVQAPGEIVQAAEIAAQQVERPDAGRR